MLRVRDQTRAVGFTEATAHRPPLKRGREQGKGAVMAQTAALPVLSGETGLTRYLEEIRRFPMLEPQEEYMLAKRWREHGDRDAAHKPFAARGQDRHGLSRLWPADFGSHF
jgi:DNA-directed RNA polymerase sigma subunit (sigma70/sigma32)